MLLEDYNLKYGQNLCGFYPRPGFVPIREEMVKLLPVETELDTWGFNPTTKAVERNRRYNGSLSGNYPGNFGRIVLVHQTIVSSGNAEELGYCTTEKPYKIWLLGNDDTSYSCFFASLEEAEDYWDLFMYMQPISVYADVVYSWNEHDLTSWVFTN